MKTKSLKNLITFGAVLSLSVFVLAGCGGSKSDETDTEETEEDIYDDIYDDVYDDDDAAEEDVTDAEETEEESSDDLADALAVDVSESYTDGNGLVHIKGTVTNNGDTALDLEAATVYLDEYEIDDYGDSVISAESVSYVIGSADYRIIGLIWTGTEFDYEARTNEGFIKGSFDWIETGETREFEYLLDYKDLIYDGDVETGTDYNSFEKCEVVGFEILSVSESVEGESYHLSTDGDGLDVELVWDEEVYPYSDGKHMTYLSGTVTNNTDHYLSSVTLYIPVFESDGETILYTSGYAITYLHDSFYLELEGLAPGDTVEFKYDSLYADGEEADEAIVVDDLFATAVDDGSDIIDTDNYLTVQYLGDVDKEASLE